MDSADAPNPIHAPATPPAVGRLERVDARTVWAHEERDFTPWLLAHADYLGEALGIDLEMEAAEHRVGPFELDLLGRDLANGAVLIAENQLAPTDHGHLGQLLTYAAGTDAGTIIWIATHVGEQHRQAIDWLNQRTDEETSFWAVELELLRIGTSVPAPHFKVVAAPNEWQKSARKIGQAAKSGGGKAVLYAAFWPKLIERLNAERPDWTRRSPDGAQFTTNWAGHGLPALGRTVLTFVCTRTAPASRDLHRRGKRRGQREPVRRSPRAEGSARGRLRPATHIRGSAGSGIVSHRRLPRRLRCCDRSRARCLRRLVRRLRGPVQACAWRNRVVLSSRPDQR